MRKNLKLFSILLLIVAFVLPGSFVYATEQPGSEKIITNVKIHKLQSESYNITEGIENVDGAELTPEQITESLGSNVTGLPDVVFTAYQINEDKYNEYKASMPLPTAYPSEYTDSVDLEPTDPSGVTNMEVTIEKNSVTGQVTPKYFIVFETGIPENVSSSIAVPFLIEFPMTKSNGFGYLTDLNIYPKNIVGNLPAIAKDITSLGNKSSSYNIGETFQYILKTTIPTNFNDYTQFTFEDSLPAGIEYIGNPTLKVGNTVLSTENFVVNPADSLSISLTEAGIGEISKIANKGVVTADQIDDTTANTDSAPIIELRFDVKLNDSAAINTQISNTATLTYDNGLGQPKEINSNSVNVITGGALFYKNDGTKALANAKFSLFENNEPMLWNDDLIRANGAAENPLFPNATPGKQIEMLSGDNGKFSIKGIAYSAMGSNGTALSQYSLEETQAPEGFQILRDRINFTVDEKSLSGDGLSILNRLRPSIPATGGIGTLIFLVAGSALMFLAYKGYKRQTAK